MEPCTTRIGQRPAWPAVTITAFGVLHRKLYLIEESFIPGFREIMRGSP